MYVVHLKVPSLIERTYSVPEYNSYIKFIDTEINIANYCSGLSSSNFYRSSVVVMNDIVESEEEAEKIMQVVQNKFSQPSNKLFIIKDSNPDSEHSYEIPLSESNTNWEDVLRVSTEYIKNIKFDDFITYIILDLVNNTYNNNYK